MAYPLAIALALAACADGTLPPMGATDPAYSGAPETPEAPEAPAAKTPPAPPSPEPSAMPAMPGMDHSHMHHGAAP